MGDDFGSVLEMGDDLLARVLEVVGDLLALGRPQQPDWVRLGAGRGKG